MDSNPLKSTLLFLLITTTTISAVKERCHPQDKKVLLNIAQSFNIAFPSWLPNTDCCRVWYGIKCDLITHRVISLTILKDMDLVGTIPPAIGDLPYLQAITFHKLPNITGTIPSSITKLQHLVMAFFDWNSLSGPIPSFFNRMNSLYELDLSFNRFSGSIPPELALAPSLLSLLLGHNLLTGSIPDSFGHFKIAGNRSEIWGTSFSLGLSHNQLSGLIPRSLGNLNFTQIDFSRNQLTGDASFLFGKDKPLEVVDLSRNELSFDFSTVEMPTSVQISVDLNHNRIYGSFPSTGMENVWYLNVSYNRLCGPIPNVGKLPTFDQTIYFHNKCLCGPPLPACIS